ncbi:hypothetical protein Kisp01_70390 [Kineosporia sp. NBRC 101677]|uniref:hypothetical protein n=1 Tax=Kineosporia sp. NBRC 101677 TaxID=3032197 RepID=UPI0024A17B00|nr:hypothetical protein [Kineosporia sp. NBRC 101677]GLY20025.1 hypothetical protein Kisp01_70390 [Kineosporia sp. NBRC 101677]
MADDVYINKPVDCDIHWYEQQEKVQAHYDGATTKGPWANMCEACFLDYGRGLGTGRGQRLIVGDKPAPDPERARSRIKAALSAGDLHMAEELAIELNGDANLDDYL